MFTIERTFMPIPGRWTERLEIKAFRDKDAMWRFLATGANSLTWQESRKGLKAGTYAFAGGKWHNVKKLDALTLAHV